MNADDSREYPLFECPPSNVVAGPRCGEFWPDPAVDATVAGELPITYVSVSTSGVIDLYMWKAETDRWHHRASTTKSKLLDEFRSRRDGE